MSSPPGKGPAESGASIRGIAAAVSGNGRDPDLVQNTRRVVMTSLGVLKEQKAVRERSRSVALAAVLVVAFIVGPLVWWAADNLISGGHLGDATSQFSLWVCIVCPALLAAALTAAWLRNR